VRELLEDHENTVENVIIIPPENRGNITDNDECDEGIDMPHDVPGEVEVDLERNNDTSSDDSETEVIHIPTTYF
jgi:hypothetical protein